MDRETHLTQLHAEIKKYAHAVATSELRPKDPVALDRLALLARTCAAGCESLAERTEALAEVVLDSA